MPEQPSQAPAAPAAVETVAPTAPTEAASPFEQAVAALQAPVDEAQPQPAATTEATEAAPAETKPDPFAHKFEALAKQERAIRDQRKAWETEQKARDAEFEPFRKAAALTKAGKHLAAMKAAGIDYSKIVEGIVSGEKDEDAPVAVHPKVAELEAKIQAMEARSQQAAVNEYRSDVRAAALAEPDKFELVLAIGQEGIDTAVEAVDQYIAQHGALPGGSREASITKALGYVEKLLETRSEPLLKTKKFSSRLAAVGTKEAAPRPQGIGQAQSTAARTLTNSLASSPPRAAAKPKSVDEMRAEAIRILEGG